MEDIKTTPASITELIRSVSIQISGSSEFARFKRMYARDRIAFVYDCLPSFAKSIAPYQEEILGLLDNGYTRIAVRGPHGLGKTAIASVITHHAVLTAESDAKVPTTASAWRQLEKYLWPEIKKTARFLDWMEVGRNIYTRDELLSTSIKLNNGIVEAFAVASDDHNTIEGAHATRMVYVFDEAKTIPRATWDAAEGAFSSEGLEVSEYQKGIISKSPIRDSSHSESIEGNGVGAIVKSSDVISEGARVLGGNSGSGSIEEKNSGEQGEQESPSNGASFHLPQGSKFTNASDTIARSAAVIDHRASHVIPTATSIYEAIAFAISTPGDPSGQFYDIHMHKPGYEDWVTRHVTLEESIRAGRISSKWAAQRRLQWGEESSTYQNRVLGEFADNSEDGIIPLSHVHAANERWLALHAKHFEGVSGRQALGVDVARGGEDKTVIAARIGPLIQKLHIFSKLSITSTSGHVRALATNKDAINIEMDGGLGAGVYDILREQNLIAGQTIIKGLHPITVSASTLWKDRSKELSFLNVRAAMWWNLRQLLDPTYGSDIALPPVEELTLDLTTPKWFMMKDATVKLESKEEIEKRLGRSTDYGDAVCLAFWQQSSGGGVVF